MSHSDDPFAGLGGEDSARVRETQAGWRSLEGREAFWLVAAIGTVVLFAAWFWYGLSFFDEMTEQCKSAASGSTSAGSAALLAGPPLLLAYLVMLIPLLLISTKYHWQRLRGALLTLVVIAAASGVAIAANELLWAGNLFAMSAAHAECSLSSP